HERRTVSGASLRARAASAVDAVVTRGRSLTAALEEAGRQLPAADRPLLHELSFGAVRHHWRLRSQIAALLEKPLKPRDSVIASLLAVGLYQLAHSRIPDHAAVTLTVEAARLLRRPKHAGLVNAVMRNFRRRHMAEAEPVDEEARFNHPAWLIDRLRRDWPGRWQQILEANNARAPMWLRVNPGRSSVADCLTELEANGIAGEPRPGFEQAIRLGEPQPAATLPGFQEGRISVQDAAAQIAAPWLLADGGCRILDACAAPGGKTAHLLELSGPGTALIAVDRDGERLAAIEDNLQRLGLGATLACADASKPEGWWDGEPFDRILLDAPCSATGVIRRHPDIKLLRRASDIEALACRQRELLERLWPLLAADGRLLYVTCSVLAEENEHVVSDFLSNTPTACEDKLLPNYNIRDVMCRRTFGFQVLPGEAGLDGFYYAGLARIK
ncbi:MAG TPA: 16S rRNA (cytosine(967)-C(5))-methyltransferase RsmB, partial [Woeseiaceae bacterium]|nr:16S rRNA (cytosine(967)-C(5))-methyltransferase RsmB [Woeseiaceae bacterium]